MDIVIGQKVFLVPYGNNARDGNKEIKETTVTRVGRIYFEVTLYGWDKIQFNRKTLQQKNTGFGYGANWKLYLSEQAIADEKEYVKLFSKIRSIFDDHIVRNNKSIPLEVLRQIAQMLEMCAR